MWTRFLCCMYFLHAVWFKQKRNLFKVCEVAHRICKGTRVRIGGHIAWENTQAQPGTAPQQGLPPSAPVPGIPGALTLVPPWGVPLPPLVLPKSILLGGSHRAFFQATLKSSPKWQNLTCILIARKPRKVGGASILERRDSQCVQRLFWGETAQEMQLGTIERRQAGSGNLTGDSRVHLGNRDTVSQVSPVSQTWPPWDEHITQAQSSGQSFTGVPRDWWRFDERSITTTEKEMASSRSSLLIKLSVGKVLNVNFLHTLY